MFGHESRIDSEIVKGHDVFGNELSNLDNDKYWKAKIENQDC